MSRAGADEHYDIVVIGGGPAGYATALYAASAGLRVAIVERDKVGGTCLHRGCVPTKEMLETASLLRTLSTAGQFGVTSSGVALDFGVSLKRKQAVVDGLYRGLRSLLEQKKVAIVVGHGRLVSAGTVKVEGEGLLTAEAIVLATGSRPRSLPVLPFDGRWVLDSDHVLELDDVPGRVAVVGGGAIGCEFASLFADLGAEAYLYEVAPTLLPAMDGDLGRELGRAFEKRRIAVRTGTIIDGHRRVGNHVELLCRGEAPQPVDVVVVAVGRRPVSDGLLGADTGVVLGSGGQVMVDEWMRTGVPGVFAIGDLVGTPQLAHVAFAEAMLVVKQVLGEPAAAIDYVSVPWCIYSHPEVATVGLSETAARDAGYDVVVERVPVAGNSRARILGETEGMVKLVAARDGEGHSGKLLGVHMVGPWVTEQIGQARVALGLDALTDEVAGLIQAHPSLSESYGEALLALAGRPLHG